MNIQTKILLRSMIRLLVQFLELANKIEENDFRKLSPMVREQKQNTKGVLDNICRGNLFMTIFFVREILEHLINSDS